MKSRAEDESRGGDMNKHGHSTLVLLIKIAADAVAEKTEVRSGGNGENREYSERNVIEEGALNG